jgi:hypothetical protein
MLLCSSIIAIEDGRVYRISLIIDTMLSLTEEPEVLRSRLTP